MAGKSALITGITGQDGSYLAELLLSKGYNVYGLIRRTSIDSTSRIQHLLDAGKIELLGGDILDQLSLIQALQKSGAEEMYNLASMSYVKASWEHPVATADYTGVSVTKALEAIRAVNPKIKFYQASSSEMFGKVQETPQKETTPFYPRSPYGVAKLYGHWITVNYRESYNVFACSGILFNHESPRRGMEFVTRKIAYNVAKIKLGLSDSFSLGNMDAKRDWGFAGDYVKAMWLMLQQDKPEDYVIGTGETHSVREFVDLAFNHVGIKDWQKYVKVNEKHMRPAEVELLLADASKANRGLNWKPSASFKELVAMMVDSDLRLLKNESSDNRH
ncbi:MAG: GDP-mannose 4,6-dehydratase [Nanoarchaeota archaeon]|nr:GDP-mannose 4,6-dehydratase [Nanoarchaeota archaeon]